MALEFLRATRWLSLASLVALGLTASVGCSVDASSGPATGASDNEPASSTDDITQLDQTKVKRQSIGNCWLYATTGWVESLHKSATGEDADISESWFTYWHWFEQIANGKAGSEVSTGGSWGTAADIILRYGLRYEKDFIPEEADSEMSARQSSALAAMNRALKDGELKDPTSRRDRKLVRKVLDEAWRLDDGARAKIDAVFGSGVEKTLDKAYATTPTGNDIMRASDFKARLKDPATGQFTVGTLADAVGKSRGWSRRTGKFAWNELDYPYDKSAQREFWKRVQRALHDGQPVIMSWHVDFNALTRDARFSLEQAQRLGTGRTGGHMTLMDDYEAEVPGFGVLKAGDNATPEQMTAALSNETKIRFVRVKNSWGGIRPDRWDQAMKPGYHDLEMAYLNGPLKNCPAGQNQQNCTTTVVPLWDVVLPAGY